MEEVRTHRAVLLSAVIASLTRAYPTWSTIADLQADCEFRDSSGAPASRNAIQQMLAMLRASGEVDWQGRDTRRANGKGARVIGYYRLSPARMAIASVQGDSNAD